MAPLAIFIGPLVLLLWIFSVIDVIRSSDDEIRHLPKIGWLLLVLFFPLVGSIAWLVAGRPQAAGMRSRAYEREVSDFPESDRPGGAAAVDAAADEEFLRTCRERAEEQRRRHRAEHTDDDGQS